MPKKCIACGYHITYLIYNPEDQPLAALHIPKSKEEAKNALKFPLNFKACANCGHIFNTEFDYYKVPYEDNSNLMYNSGIFWQEHMVNLTNNIIEKYDIKGKKLVDIGCGDGGFLKLFFDKGLGNTCIAYEPGIEADNAAQKGITVYKDYFNPKRDLLFIKPDVIFCRHVIEHLDNPRKFVADIAYWANIYNIFPIFIVEVPKIDNAINQSRINDFLYEHVSNFTEYSLKNMFKTTGFEILEIKSAYDDEVAIAIVKPKKNELLNKIKNLSNNYHQNLLNQKLNFHKKLQELIKQNKKIAFWGATGKGASFLNSLDIFDNLYPIVIDSDYRKCGKFVPRTSQEIQSPEYLTKNEIDIIIITTQWRAKDICEEIKVRNIKYKEIYIMKDLELQIYDA